MVEDYVTLKFLPVNAVALKVLLVLPQLLYFHPVVVFGEVVGS